MKSASNLETPVVLAVAGHQLYTTMRLKSPLRELQPTSGFEDGTAFDTLSAR